MNCQHLVDKEADIEEDVDYISKEDSNDEENNSEIMPPPAAPKKRKVQENFNSAIRNIHPQEARKDETYWCEISYSDDGVSYVLMTKTIRVLIAGNLEQSVASLVLSRSQRQGF